MLYTIDELRQEVFKDVFCVYEIFKNYFGEEYVDLQNVSEDDDMLNQMATWDIEESGEHEHNYEVSPLQLSQLKNGFYSLKPYIIVWWPEVRVTNENDRFVDIQDLYAKIELTMDGRIPYENVGFELNRSTFNAVQFASGYIH